MMVGYIYGVHLVTGIPGIGKVLLFGFTCIVSFVDGWVPVLSDVGMNHLCKQLCSFCRYARGLRL